MLHAFRHLFTAGLLAGALLASRPAAAQHTLRFTSPDDDMVLVSTTALNGGSFTYELWVNYSAPQLLGRYNTLIELGSDERALYVYDDSSIVLYGGTQQVVAPHGLFRPQRWNHVACTYDDQTSQAKVYFNGAMVASVTTSFPTSVATELGIGKHNGDTGWQGEIDEVVIWSSARTAAQIQTDMLAAVQPAAAGLVAYYKFNGGTGQVAVNQKPGGPAGQLGNDPAVDQQDPQWTNNNAPVPMAAPAELLATAPLTLHPNPAPAGTAAHLTYTLAAPATAMLTVEDALGRRVVTLADGAGQAAGEHTVSLNTTGLPTGLYVCRLTTPTGTLARRLLVE